MVDECDTDQVHSAEGMVQFGALNSLATNSQTGTQAAAEHTTDSPNIYTMNTESMSQSAAEYSELATEFARIMQRAMIASMSDDSLIKQIAVILTNAKLRGWSNMSPEQQQDIIVQLASIIQLSLMEMDMNSITVQVSKILQDASIDGWDHMDTRERTEIIDQIALSIQAAFIEFSDDSDVLQLSQIIQNAHIDGGLSSGHYTYPFDNHHMYSVPLQDDYGAFSTSWNPTFNNQMHSTKSTFGPVRSMDETDVNAVAELGVNIQGSLLAGSGNEVKQTNVIVQVCMSYGPVDGLGSTDMG